MDFLYIGNISQLMIICNYSYGYHQLNPYRNRTDMVVLTNIQYILDIHLSDALLLCQ